MLRELKQHNNGGSSGSGSGGARAVRSKCLDLVKKLLPEFWGDIASNLEKPPLIDVDSTPSYSNVENGTMANDDAGLYFNNARPGQTVGQAIDDVGERGAITIWGSTGSPNGIFHRQNIAVTGNFLLHEVLHHVFQKTDSELVDLFSLKTTSGLTSSQLISRFFSSGCQEKYRDVL